MKNLILLGFLFAGSTSFAQTRQAESVKTAESKTEVSEYPTDPVLVPADLKKHALEQTNLIGMMPIMIPVVTKKRVGFVSISNPHF